MTPLATSIFPSTLIDLKDHSTLTGLPGGSKAFFITSLVQQKSGSWVVVTPEDADAEGLSVDVEAWTALVAAHQRPAVIFVPEFDEAMRIAALGEWSREKNALLICSKGSLEKPVYSPEQLKDRTLELRPGQSYPRTTFLEKLAQGGYSRTDMVELEGEIAVRGEVVDVWPAGLEKPWRLLFDGDTLESIRALGRQQSGRGCE